MTDTGIARQLDAVGRITLPKELRNTLHLTDRDILEIYTEDGKIILKRSSAPADIFTGSMDNLIEYEGKYVSKETVVELAKLAHII